MKKVTIIGLTLATTFVCEVGMTLVKNRIQNKPLNEKYRAYKNGDYKFEPVIFEMKSEAQDTLDNLQNIMSEYGVLSVADLKDNIGAVASFIDNSYGWKDISKTTIKKVKSGYILDLPKLVILE